MPDSIIPESTYPELKEPVFASDIPAPLLAKASDSERYILEQLSMLGQYVKWSTPALVQISGQVRRTNGRLIAVENWRDKVMAITKSWWGVAGGFFAIVGGIAAIVEIVEFIGTHWNG